jgi:hypothetical protein
MQPEASLALLLLAACLEKAAEYRWVSARPNRVLTARASLVLTPAQRRPGWWIVPAHSSVAKLSCVPPPPSS